MVQRRKRGACRRGHRRSSRHRGSSGHRQRGGLRTRSLPVPQHTHPREKPHHKATRTAQRDPALTVPATNTTGHGGAERTCPAPRRQARPEALPVATLLDQTPQRRRQHLPWPRSTGEGPPCLLGTPHVWPAHCRDLTGSPRQHCRGSARPHHSTPATQTDMEQNPTHAIRKGRNRRRRP